ncbi:2Fe-2S iron-sulfur cluster-binding protein [Natribaculum luteum]|uniref:2Fe-2S iron-sulfur cluster-binding protein n=1 Tax=Natribaculum luteum TaxID=1586232 RepID=A0ABD5NW07_9EURY|nr:2Fe-2S iron-sulfur cluster-binding protein [Natribaculum luteum]
MSGSEATTREVTLTWRDGRRETVRATEAQTILEAAEARAVGLPFGCRTGACATCTGRVADGRVTHDREPRALKPRHLERGYVLCCIARPRTDCRIEVGADVRTAMVSNPWK